MSSKSNKRSKSYYINNVKRRKCAGTVQFGKMGFLITCNNRERESTKEASDLLGEYADRLYGPAEGSQQEPSATDDIQDAIQKEIDNLKSASSTASRFTILDTGTKNCVFIQTSLPDPVHLVHSIMTDVLSTQKQRARYICRLMPVPVVCRAHVEDIEKASLALLEQHFRGTEAEGKTFAIVFRARYNDSVKRDILIPALASKIQDLNPLNKANLSNPDLAVVVEVLGKYSMIAVLSDYYRLKKYNLLELIDKPKVAVPKAEHAELADKAEKDCEEKVETEKQEIPE